MQNETGKTIHIATFANELGTEKMFSDVIREGESTRDFLKRAKKKIERTPDDKFDQVSNYKPVTIGKIQVTVEDAKQILEEEGYEVIAPEEQSTEIQEVK